MIPQLIQTAAFTTHLTQVNTWADYDAQVQLVLDEYWPGVTDLSSLKVKEDKHVYKAMNGDDKVIVKSVNYDPELE